MQITKRELYKYRLRIGKAIRELRKGHNLRQEDLSLSIGIKQSQLSKIERGKYFMKMDLFFRICRQLQTEPCEIFLKVKGDDND